MNEIWIDCYDIIRFLYRNRSETIKNIETKEWNRIYDMKDPAIDQYLIDRENKKNDNNNEIKQFDPTE